MPQLAEVLVRQVRQVLLDPPDPRVPLAPRVLRVQAHQAPAPRALAHQAQVLALRVRVLVLVPRIPAELQRVPLGEVHQGGRVPRWEAVLVALVERRTVE